MLIDSNINLYKKLLKEAEDQYLDFGDEDVDFSKDYNIYKNVTVPRYDIHKIFNDKYPEFIEEGGIVNYLVIATNEFRKLVEERIQEVEESDAYDDAYDSFYDNYNKNDFRDSDLFSEIESFLQKEYSEMQVYTEEYTHVDDCIIDFINQLDYSDIEYEIVRSLESDQIKFDSYRIGESEQIVYLEKDDSVPVNDWEVSLDLYVEEFQ